MDTRKDLQELKRDTAKVKTLVKGIKAQKDNACQEAIIYLLEKSIRRGVRYARKT